MRLRTKLSIVLALLVSTLAINVALSIWSIRFLEKELSMPLRSMQSVMYRLHEIKRGGEREIDLITSTTNSPDSDLNQTPNHTRELIQTSCSQITEIELQSTQLLDELSDLPGVMLRSGVNTIMNMQKRSRLIRLSTEQWSRSLNQSDAQNLLALIDARHELIERVEGQILADAQLAADFGDTLKTRMYSIILVTLIGALAIGLLMATFIRRWVFSPIEQLRAGALRMSQGNFDQPIPSHTNDELGELSSEFNRMGELIKDMQTRKIEQERLAAMGEMAQRTVHNLRTPLAGIRALSETTLDELDQESDLRDLQSRIISTVDRFELWLKEMLRASAPLDLHIGPYSPSALVESIIDAHKAAGESNDLRIELTIEAETTSAHGDAHHLEHAITAILSNAIGFAPKSSSIYVHLRRWTDNEKDYWTLRIANMGAMIPQSLHHTIFRPYFTTRQSGTGIGLALSKRVIDQHHGLIEVESPVEGMQDAGCAFLIKVPLNPTE